MNKDREADEELVFGEMTDAEIKKAMFWAAFEYLRMHGIGVIPSLEDEIAFRKFMANLDGLIEKYGKKSQTPTKDTERRPI